MTNPPFKKPPELTDPCAVCGHHFAKHSMDDIPRCPGVRAWQKTTFTPVEKAAKEETQTVAQASEQIGAATQRAIEVSQAAKDAFLAGWKLRLASSDPGVCATPVQRAMDAARYDERAKVRVAVSEIEADRRREQAEVARLTKELAEADSQNDRNLDALSEHRKKIEGLRLDLQGARNELAECHGDPHSSDPEKLGHAGLIALLRIQRDKATKELAEERESWIRMGVSETMARKPNVFEYIKQHEQQLAAAQSAIEYERGLTSKAQSALAEKEKELAEVMNQWARSDIDIRAELSTERAAREKAEAACGNWKSIRHRDQEVEKALRAQLQQAEQERDQIKASAAQLGIVEGNTFHDAIENFGMLRAELAATQETARRVERERGALGAEVIRAVKERDSAIDLRREDNSASREALRLISKERNALQKQNAALASELANSAQELKWARATLAEERTVRGVDKLIARNAELVKALETADIDLRNLGAGTLHESRKRIAKALNQSPE